MTFIKTFNPAKQFSAEVLLELIKSHTDAKLKTRLGAVSVEEANKVDSGTRVITRFNSLKERIILQQTLINEIEATIILNKVKSEIDLIDEIKKQLSLVEDNFDKKQDEIITKKVINGVKKYTLTKLFSELNVFLDTTYVHIQRMMTKNKLLFNTDDDEYLEDQEIKAKIIEDNRRA